MFSAEEVEGFRRQERDKLYGQLSKQTETLNQLQGQMATIEAERKAAAEASAKAQAEAEAAAKAEAEAKMSATELVTAREADFNRRWAEMQAQQEQERAIWAKEREFAELRDYAQQQVAANREHIVPELLDLVTGSTRQEIDASIETLKTKTTAILQGISGAQAQAAQASPRGVSVTGRPDVDLLNANSGTRNLSPQDIANMSPAEYAQNRQQLLAASSNHVRTRGLYG
jgi:hypothetical protein